MKDNLANLVLLLVAALLLAWVIYPWPEAREDGGNEQFIPASALER